MGGRGSQAAPSPARTAMVPARDLLTSPSLLLPGPSETSHAAAKVSLAGRKEEKQPRAEGWGELRSREEAVGEAVFPYMG